MKGQLLLIECEPLGRALDLLRSVPGVLDAAVFGRNIHAVVADAAAAVPVVRDLLAKTHIQIGRVESIPATLEDVFVSLTSGRGFDRSEAA